MRLTGQNVFVGSGRDAINRDHAAKFASTVTGLNGGYVTVTADVGDDSSFSNGPLTITAFALLPSSGHSAKAYAVGSAGGTLLGVQATYVKAEDDSDVTAYGGKNVHLPSNNVTIAAANTTLQNADATGIAVSGYIALGATIAETASNTHTIAYLDTGAVTSSASLGVLSIAASGNDTNNSDAIAGSGGLFAGAAAVATTDDESTTSATLILQGTLAQGGENNQRILTPTALMLFYIADAKTPDIYRLPKGSF